MNFSQFFFVMVHFFFFFLWVGNTCFFFNQSNCQTVKRGGYYEKLEKGAFLQTSKIVYLNRWLPPPVGVFKLNYNALGNPGMVGLGGLVRDSDSTTILSYSDPAGHF